VGDVSLMQAARSQTARQVKAFGVRLAVILEKKKITQVELAGRTGLSESYISMLCRGIREPTLTTQNLLAMGLRVKRAEFWESTAKVVETPKVSTPEE
jgi:transcriptional regulator with XRE-family HTH domain